MSKGRTRPGPSSTQLRVLERERALRKIRGRAPRTGRKARATQSAKTIGAPAAGPLEELFDAARPMRAEPAPAPTKAARARKVAQRKIEGDAEREEYRAMQEATLAHREGGGHRDREWLRGRGYLALKKHSDLLPYGYQIIVWASPSMPDEPIVYEYAPYPYKQTRGLDVPPRRMTATTIEEQQAVHAYVGARDSDVCETQQELF